MRSLKNLKNLAEEATEIDPEEKPEKPQKQSRSRKEKKREGQGVLGGILAVISIVAIVLVIRTFDTDKKPIVKGVQTKQASTASEEAAERVQKNLQKRIDAIKKQAENLDVADAVSSSEQVKKLIEDLQNLQQVPKNQLKDACLNVCKGL